jgi:hypothetical protein
VLRPGGHAVFCVPIPRRPKSIMRGQPDRQGHWWLIGRDWQDCYEAAGFRVRTSSGRSCPKEFGVKPDNLVSVCTRS